ncbi:TadE/TadG family type IV pilus assembly protein [Lignipirellula cremea]|uniref:TadE-like protein n=1 Tax=Lignipirellula cremea TaxID=2528010 RepID=A0A518DUF5_9BACT|nr:TadE/TadG family type IV pilus assembly protein [Lignipirellula cremea]QDU95466.1 TadE-like protein [Lignipirellula cremea]
MHQQQKSHRFRSGSRRGTSTVEFALAAPIVFVMFFAAIEYSRVNIVRHTSDNAAYEAARRGIIPGATAEQVETAARNVLATAFILNAEVEILPDVIEDDSEEITVTIHAPMADNSYGVRAFFPTTVLTSRITMRRETVE